MSFAKKSNETVDLTNNVISSSERDYWHIFIVDDDVSIHQITELILSDYTFGSIPLKFTHAYSAKEAQDLLENENDFAVLFLDVVMETDHAGLDLVNYIRNVIKNQFLRIILRTGQPGLAPELRAITEYDINDYKEKSELTADKMISCVTAALRSFRDITTIHELANLRKKLQLQITEHNEELRNVNQKLKSEIDERIKIEQQLASTNHKLISIINNSSALISLKDMEGRYDMVNEAFKKHLKLKLNDIIGKTDRDIFTEDTAEIIKNSDQQVIQSKQPLQCEEILPSIEGDHYYLCVKFPLFDDKGGVYRICSICTDITERLQSQSKILYLAQYDLLTDLPNRSLFIDRLEQAISRTPWHKDHIAVLFIDLDKFKAINDTLGHDVGDQLLIEVSKRLKSKIRKGDSVCRLGGDEFSILLTELANENDITRIAENILTSLSEPYMINGRELIVTSSIGISRSPLDASEVHLLMKKADIAMYKAKNLGRNRYCFYLKEDDARASEQLALEVDMRKMLTTDKVQLFLLYQPKVDINSGESTSVEALVRWLHPTKGVIPPSEFIPLLEETGLIIEAGKWILHEACRFASRANNMGYKVKVAVNLSSRQLKQDDLLDMIQETLTTTACQPNWLELEVTEGVIIDDFEHVKTILDAISALGVSLAIDDFGTGYSSLSYLKHLPFNTLKIDRSFIVDAPTNSKDKAIVTTIAQLAYNLDMTVVAEGVETNEQYHVVKSVIKEHEKKQNQIQGFIFSKPLSEYELLNEFDITEKWNNAEKGYDQNN